MSSLYNQTSRITGFCFDFLLGSVSSLQCFHLRQGFGGQANPHAGLSTLTVLCVSFLVSFCRNQSGKRSIRLIAFPQP